LTSRAEGLAARPARHQRRFAASKPCCIQYLLRGDVLDPLLDQRDVGPVPPDRLGREPVALDRYGESETCLLQTEVESERTGEERDDREVTLSVDFA
jgi:hypothetical protein